MNAAMLLITGFGALCVMSFAAWVVEFRVAQERRRCADICHRIAERQATDDGHRAANRCAWQIEQPEREAGDE